MENNKNRLDQLFQQARDQQPESSFVETKKQFLNGLKGGRLNPKVQGIAKSINFKNRIIMLSTVSIIVTSAILIFNNNNSTNTIETLPLTEEKKIVTIEESKKDSIIEEAFTIETVSMVDMEVHVITSTFQNDSTDSLIVNVEEIEYKETVQPVFIKAQNVVNKHRADSVYNFPKLTPEEIQANNERKAKMIKDLAKLNKKNYAYIPSGSFKYEEKDVSVQAFYMQTTEVTCLEYRTFLFDLLIQDRKEEFLKAKPDQSKWMDIDGQSWAFNKPMEENYFSHPAYNNYPVNNVSREGAKMYCMWLSTELMNSTYRKAEKMVGEVRLPSDYEWMHAAYGDKYPGPYPWGGPLPKNSKNCYIANFKPETDTSSIEQTLKAEPLKNFDKKIKKAQKEGKNYLDGVYIKEYPASDSIKKVLHNNKYCYKADGAFFTASVTSYYPNAFGLYNMSGNVAEMVLNWDDKTAGTKGGGWLSELKHIKITGEDEYKGVTDPHVNIGFRVVMTFLKR